MESTHPTVVVSQLGPVAGMSRQEVERAWQAASRMLDNCAAEAAGPGATEADVREHEVARRIEAMLHALRSSTS